MKEKKDAGYFEAKMEEAEALTNELCKGIETKTASEEFDIYCRYTYMDNVLRGGYPIQLEIINSFVYSRKHGDLERDYNYFSMLPNYIHKATEISVMNQNRSVIHSLHICRQRKILIILQLDTA